MNRSAAISFALLLGSSILGSSILAAQTASQSQPSFATQGIVVIQKTTTAPDGSVSWTTQAASQEEAQRAVANQLASSCPVSLHARQAAEAFRREVGEGDANPKGLAQHLHLTATNPQARRIVAASVTVRGFANKARMVQTMTTQDTSDAAKTMDVKFTSQPGKEVSAYLAVPGLSAVSVIELNSVTYSDGSTWKLASGSVCRSPIDGFMLISIR
jgi:hypothetical protein